MGEGKVIYRAGVVPTFINTQVAKARILWKGVVLLLPALASMERFVKMQIPGPTLTS